MSENLEKEKANHEEYLKFKASSESDEKEQMKKLSDEIEKLSEDNTNLREEADQAKIDLDIAAKAGSEIAAKIKSLEEAVSKSGALQKELTDIRTQLETKQTELGDANDRASKAAESAAAATTAAAAADKKANKAGKTKPTAADKMKDEQIERLTEELADKEDELECAEEEVKRLKEKVEGVSRSDVLCSFLVSFPLLPIQYSHNIYHIYPHLYYVLCHSGSSRIRLLQIQQPTMLPQPTLLSASRTSFLKPATKLLP